MSQKKPDEQVEMRSAEWFGREGKYGFIPRSWMRSQGFGPELFDGRPVIGICNTWSELNPCNRHLRELAEHVKRGVLLAGGYPLEFPVMSLGEPLMRPTTMMFRNLVSMDVEETIRANPIDGVVLLAGCDKTTPALLMGAASCDIPSILVSGGPMLNGRFKGQDLGSGTDVFRFDEEYRAGRLSKEEYEEAEAAMSRSAGSCMTMGTASTMASLAEALGIALPMNGAIPAVDSRRKRLAEEAGHHIVSLVHNAQSISHILTRAAFENAIVVNGAIGGSTNAIVHLLALAGRVGVTLSLDDWDRLGDGVPCLVDLKPSGRFLMEDFYYSGGVPAVMKRIEDMLDLTAPTVEGGTIGARLARAECYNDEVIRQRNNPVAQQGGIVVLRGNLAPNGAVIKPSAASKKLMSHRGKAVVFENVEDYRARIDDPDLPVDENSILVLKCAGPVGYPGMPEVGNLALPTRLVRQGVTDMVRISDGRMSGTAYGTVVLHVSPESAVGGPLALARTGDEILLDVGQHRLELLISEEEWALRRSQLVLPAPHFDRGYGQMFINAVQQAHLGVDFDYLVGRTDLTKSKESF